MSAASPPANTAAAKCENEKAPLLRRKFYFHAILKICVRPYIPAVLPRDFTAM